jgi:homoserine dehydrogenase
MKVRFVLVGLGNLGRRFCEILIEKDAHLQERYGLEFSLVGAADSGGAACAAEGLDLSQVVHLKQAGNTVGRYSAGGRLGLSALELLSEIEADVLLEASPVNLDEGAEPGLSCIRMALQRSMHVVTPNKGPMVLAYRELHELAAAQGVELRFDGTVAGGLPALYLGGRDLRGALVHRIEAVPNLVTGLVMDLLAEGTQWDEALVQARQEGVLEADAAWDLDGWDAAAKLVILVNTTQGPAPFYHLEDVARRGIGGLEPGELRSARRRGERYRLVATARRRSDGGYELSVAPVSLPPEHPLGQLGRRQMGVVFYTDIYGTITAAIDEPDPFPSAATMLRDLLDIYSGRSFSRSG